MKLKNLFADEDAVSPVIGVILMVAITVILAAVIGTFVLGLGNQVSSTTPTAQFTMNYANNSANAAGGGNDTLTVTHDGGDKIKAMQLNASVSGALDGNGSSLALKQSLFGTGGSVTAGTTDTIGDANGPAFNNLGAATGAATHLNMDKATVRILWTSESGDNSATLRKWSGPDA